MIKYVATTNGNIHQAYNVNGRKESKMNLHVNCRLKMRSLAFFLVKSRKKNQ